MSVLPPADEWNRAVEHSRANPAHILGPYEDSDGRTRMDCGTCGFDTALSTPEPPVHVCIYDVDGDCLICGRDIFASG